MDRMKDMMMRLENVLVRMEALRLDEFLRHRTMKKRIVSEFLIGIARGAGFSIGFTILGAVVLILLRNAALVNLPVIGEFLAELVRIVERNL